MNEQPFIKSGDNACQAFDYYDLDVKDPKQEKKVSFSKFDDKNVLQNIREFGSLGNLDDLKISMLRQTQRGTNTIMPEKMSFKVQGEVKNIRKQELTLMVDGLKTVKDVKRIENILLDGVMGECILDVDVNIKNSSVNIIHTTNIHPKEIIKALKEGRYHAGVMKRVIEET